MNKSKILVFMVMAVLALMGVGCHDTPDRSVVEGVFVPEAPDYEDEGMWTIVRNDVVGSGAHVFYVASTWEFDWTTSDGRTCHYADPSLASHRADMSIEIDGIAEYMAEGNNFYAPYYRHITLDSWAISLF